MQNKILLNTIILYIKIVITISISFVSVPIVLRALGTEDYGVYMLVAGVISMLMFLNVSMTVATQRYLSVTIGTKNVNKVTDIFTCSIYLHLLIGLMIIVGFESTALFIFDGFLNINPIRIPAAKIIYQCLVVSTFFTIISVPYDAVLNAKENMLVFSLITILGSILRLSLAILLLYVSVDKLILYGVGYALVSIVEVLLKRVYVSYTYCEMKRLPLRSLDKKLFKEMLAFSGWNTFGAFAMACRNQGIAIVLNVFYGTIVNAAYGVANQVNGILASFAGSLQKAINPQLMQSEGADQRSRMLFLAETSTKMSVLIFATIAIPLILEMEIVLGWWLGEVPAHTVRFCQLVLVLNLIMQFTAGVMAAIQAVGNIKIYQITMGVVLFANIPIGYLILYFGGTAEMVLLAMCVVEIIALIIRVIFARRLVQLSIRLYMRNILLPLLCVLSITTFVGWLVHLWIEDTLPLLQIICVFVVTTLTILLTTFYVVFDKTTRKMLIEKIHKR